MFMNEKILKELRSGFETAYVDLKRASGESLRPSFITNNIAEGKKVLTTIEEELLSCEEFKIGVAFITDSGLAPLLQTLKELEANGIKGQILTTNYLNFSEPTALEKLSKLSNITLKMYDVQKADSGFHSKGYIFKREELYHIIIGSSNLTQAALCVNKEWNTRLISTDSGEFGYEVISEFENLWNSKYTFDYEVVKETYKQQYQIIKRQREIARSENPISLAKYTLEPNSMQIGFISNLKQIVNSGEKRALLISATGTGKTYASAFAMRELGFKKVLFVVHRNQIAKQAKESFENVFGNSIKSGYIAGIGNKEEGINADYVFATVQSLTRNNLYTAFPKDYFDCCIYDESHHATADSYQKLMEYFTPEFSLGMTATPDKRDDNIEGHNVYELFDHNIAYEIRLQKAMEERLLCPFHYFGIKDLSVISDDDTSCVDTDKFSYLTSDERVKLISQQVEYFGHSGKRVKGLMFCSRIEEARELSSKLNQYGYKTIALSGADSEEKRSEAIDLLTKELESEESYNKAYRNGNGVTIYPNAEYLDYILTVDIFSEGADIVEVNQIIMLRPTQSPIVFIQQLGRGLRKSSEKEYVVVLDFIANYRNNFMIPIALSGDRSYNKDNIRRYLMEGNKTIPGESTIHFDPISKKRIYEAIDNANFSDLQLIKENYLNLKNKLGRIPSLLDFDEYGEMDVLRIFDNKNLGSYYAFLSRYEKDFTISLSNKESKIIEFISKKFANGKRVQELELLRIILDTFNMEQEVPILKELSSVLSTQYGKQLDDIQKKNLINIMTNEFSSSSAKSRYEDCILIEPDENDDYFTSNLFKACLMNSDFYDMIHELVDFGISRYNRDYSERYQNTDLVLNQKYTYGDVCRLLNWECDMTAVMFGYKYDEVTKTFPVFINYDKDENIGATIKYEDHFISRGELIAISKSGRTITSDDVQNFLYARERGIQVELFVRKNKDDKISKEFYYLGHMTANKDGAKEFTMPGTNKTAVEINWILDNPVKEELYQYIING